MYNARIRFLLQALCRKNGVVSKDSGCCGQGARVEIG